MHRPRCTAAVAVANILLQFFSSTKTSAMSQVCNINKLYCRQAKHNTMFTQQTYVQAVSKSIWNVQSQTVTISTTKRHLQQTAHCRLPTKPISTSVQHDQVLRKFSAILLLPNLLQYGSGAKSCHLPETLQMERHLPVTCPHHNTSASCNKCNAARLFLSTPSRVQHSTQRLKQGGS